MKKSEIIGIILILGIMFFGTSQDARLFIGDVILRDTLSGALKTDRLYLRDSLIINAGSKVYLGDASIYQATGSLRLNANTQTMYFNTESQIGAYTFNVGDGYIGKLDSAGLELNCNSATPYTIQQIVDDNSYSATTKYIKVHTASKTYFIPLWEKP